MRMKNSSQAPNSREELSAALADHLAVLAETPSPQAYKQAAQAVVDASGGKIDAEELRSIVYSHVADLYPVMDEETALTCEQVTSNCVTGILEQAVLLQQNDAEVAAGDILSTTREAHRNNMAPVTDGHQYAITESQAGNEVGVLLARAANDPANASQIIANARKEMALHIAV
jgi:hypothetical protein